MFETQTDINVSIYIGGKTLRDNEKSLLQIYDYLRRIGGLFDAEVELESHAYKETSHYDTETQTTYVGELWMSSDGEWPVPVSDYQEGKEQEITEQRHPVWIGTGVICYHCEKFLELPLNNIDEGEGVSCLYCRKPVTLSEALQVVPRVYDEDVVKLPEGKE